MEKTFSGVVQLSKWNSDMAVHSPELVCHAKELGPIFKVKVTVRAYIITVWLFKLYLLNWWFLFFAAKLSLLVDHHKPKHTLKMCCCCVKGQGYSNGSKFNLIQCLDGTFWTAETLVTELQSSNVVWSVCFAVVKVRVTAKVQNVIDFLPRWYLLNDITSCSQT